MDTTVVDEENKFLSATDVCSIIESCAKSGVRRLIFGDLELFFGPKPGALDLTQEGFTPVDHERQEAGRIEQEAQLTREEQLEMLMIENPVEYERQIRDGELGNDGSESESGDDDGDSE